MSECRPTEKPRVWYQILTILISCIISFTAGVFFSWTSPAIPHLIDESGPYKFTLEECSYLGVISSLTTAVTCIIPGPLVDKIGRKSTLLLMPFLYIIPGILFALTTNIYVFYLGRIFTGCGDAFLFASHPVYIGEITTPTVRGTWGNMNSVNIFVGQFAINVVGGYMDLRTTSWICLVPPVFFLILFPFMPESPYFYVMKGKVDDARKSLQRLRRVKNVEEEIHLLQTSVKRQMSESGSWRDLFVVASNRKSVIAVILMRIAQQAAGFAAFSFYGKHIFQIATSNISATDSAIIYSGAVAAMSFLGSYVVEKFGRRNSIVCSTAGAGSMLLAISIFFYIDEYCPDLDTSNLKFLPLVGMLVYVVMFSCGLGLVPTLMLGELFSASMKAKGLCIANITFGLSVCIMSKLFQVFQVAFGMYFPYGFFAICSLVNSILMYFVIPETKGKTLEEIQLSLKK